MKHLETIEKIRLNIGSHNKIVKDENGNRYINVDALALPNADIVHNLTKFPWPFKDNLAEEILAEEFLEHISFRYTYKVLKECYRVLRPKAKIRIQVPDCGKMMEMYVNKEICQCVPHKVGNWNDFKADNSCFNCSGKAKVNPDRWFYAFVGAQKHNYDQHLNIFTKEKIEKDLEQANFKNIIFQDNPYKIIVEAIK